MGVLLLVRLNQCYGGDISMVRPPACVRSDTSNYASLMMLLHLAVDASALTWQRFLYIYGLHWIPLFYSVASKWLLVSSRNMLPCTVSIYIGYTIYVAPL